MVRESIGNHSVIPSDDHSVNTVMPVGASVTKAKGRIITTQNKLNAKVGSAILVSGNVSCATGNNIQSADQIQDASSMRDNSSMHIF